MSADVVAAPNSAKAPPDKRQSATPAPAASQGTQRFKRLLKEAHGGTLEAQYQVGLLHASGKGTRKNMAEALAWMTRAAQRGHAGAQFMLGAHFAADSGNGQRDEARAMDWLYQAARQGHARAHQRLAQLLRESGAALSAHHESTAAGLGLAESQLALAREQLQPTVDTELHSSGRAWLRRAAQQGLPAAQTELGKLCWDSATGPEAQDEGLRWLGAAADQAWPPAWVALHERGIPTEALAQTAVPDPLDAAARHALGLMHERGMAGWPANRLKAARWFERAADQGWAPAHTALGRLAEERDPTAAVAHYQRAADAGETEAQLALACVLRQPGRSPLDRLTARRWLAQAAQSGHAKALLLLADDTLGTDPELAAEAWRLAAEAGSAEAQYRLGKQLLARTTPDGRREGERWLRQACEQGHAGALGALGVHLRNAARRPDDAVAGLRHLQKAAELGDAPARWHLALMLAAGGPDLPRDTSQALALCHEAADTGFVPAMATMGVLCASTDRAEEAVRWWRLAAESGDLEAQYNLAQALAKGRGAPVDDAQALSWMLRAAENGLAPAQSQLGVMYATGRGVACDPIEAHKWFFIARLAGDADGRENTDRSRQRLDPAQRDEGERRARAWRSYHKRHV